MTKFSDIGFSDIQRAEAVQIAEALLAAGRADQIPQALRQGWTLEHTRQQLAAEAAPAAPAATTAPAPSAQTTNRRTDTDAHAALEQVSQERFAAMRRPHPPWG